MTTLEDGSLLFGSEVVHLDYFQHELLRMTEAASPTALYGFFDKNYEPFMRFLLHLYICSLTMNHPSRKRKDQSLTTTTTTTTTTMTSSSSSSSSSSDTKLTSSEHAILSQWAHILTLSPPTALVMHPDGDIDEVPLNQLNDVLQDYEHEELVVVHPESPNKSQENDIHSSNNNYNNNNNNQQHYNLNNNNNNINTITPLVSQSRTDVAKGGVSPSTTHSSPSPSPNPTSNSNSNFHNIKSNSTTAIVTNASNNNNNNNNHKTSHTEPNLTSASPSSVLGFNTSTHKPVVSYYTRKTSIRESGVPVKQRIQVYQQTQLTASQLTNFNHRNAVVDNKKPPNPQMDGDINSGNDNGNVGGGKHKRSGGSAPKKDATLSPTATGMLRTPPKKPDPLSMQVDFDEELGINNTTDSNPLSSLHNKHVSLPEHQDSSFPRHHDSVSSNVSVQSYRDRARAHSSTQSLGNLAMLATNLAYSRDGARSPVMIYNRSLGVANAVTMRPLTPGRALEAVPVPSLNTEEETDEEDRNVVKLGDEHENKNNGGFLRPHITKRESMWDGVLDINNVIMSPETPKWRPQIGMEQNELFEDELLNSLLCILSPDPSNTDHGILPLDKELEVATTSVFCFYLPLIAIIGIKSGQGLKVQGDLLEAIRERIRTEVDCKQAFEFLLNAYRDCQDMQKTYSKALTLEERETLRQQSAIESTNNTNTSIRELSKSRSDPISLASTTPNTGNQPSASNNSNTSNTPTTSRTSASTSISATSSNSDNNVPLQRQTVVQKEVENPISFFKNILKNKLKPGTDIKINEKSNIRDPVKDNAPPLSRIEVRKIIQSNSKPLLVDLFVAGKREQFEYLSSTVILKQGDDLRIDAAVVQVFRLFNKIWREEGLNYNDCPVRAHYYKCVAMAPDFGCIELIPGCKPLRLVGEIDENITVSQTFNLVASSAGSYVASFVMGIRDRHFDNVLIRASDCTLFHIDFGYVLGKSVSIDTSKFAITQDLKRLMGPYWQEFVQLGVQAYLALRVRYQEIVMFAKMAFCYLVEPNEVEEFIRSILHVDDKSEAEAARYIAKKLKESPDSVRTKFKNVVHDIATRVKRV